MWETGGVAEMYAIWKCDFPLWFVDLIYSFAYADLYRKLDG